jgi:polyhydroxyalkanoate synthesis regulator phasin
VEALWDQAAVIEALQHRVDTLEKRLRDLEKKQGSAGK